MTTTPEPLGFQDLVRLRGRRRATAGRRAPHRGVWVPHGSRDTVALRLEALTVVRPDAVATGWTAALFHGHPWPPRDPPLEVATGDRRIRRPGVLSRQFTIPDGQHEEFIGPHGHPIRVATFDRALFDLARYLPRDDAVAALDGAGRLGVDARAAVPTQAELNRDVSRRGTALRHAALCAPLAESPMETRLRMFARDIGLDRLVVQYRVPGTPYRLDLADPERRIALEYDGEHHGYSDQHTRDVERRNRLTARGWMVIVVTKRQLWRTPDELAAQLLRAFAERS
ncbi:DUF559 domain-containing protein [Dietzia sp. SYD-A1]|uniref:DUF559 domain-containing protein n=1 Tax=Dietzia sp. SYD-A1 TaxID=2780141 RepID=UPI0018915586|nr:DUF559 domain-containing protein [Dietzia sp. SYD-A1]